MTKTSQDVIWIETEPARSQRTYGFTAEDLEERGLHKITVTPKQKAMQQHDITENKDTLKTDLDVHCHTLMAKQMKQDDRNKDQKDHWFQTLRNLKDKIKLQNYVSILTSSRRGS